MKCPKCKTFHSFKVIDSRARKRGDIYRRRKCLQCGNKITTQEVIINNVINPIDTENYKKLVDLAQELKIIIIKLNPEETT